MVTTARATWNDSDAKQELHWDMVFNATAAKPSSHINTSSTGKWNSSQPPFVPNHASLSKRESATRRKYPKIDTMHAVSAYVSHGGFASIQREKCIGGGCSMASTLKVTESMITDSAF